MTAATYLGIDIGTTRIKALLYSAASGTVVAEAQTPTPVSTHGAETRDAEQVFDAVVRVAGDCLDLGDETAAVAGIGLTSLGEEMVLLDGEGGPVEPVLPWFDQRGSTMAKETGDAGMPAVLRQSDPSFSVFTLRWLARNRPEAAARTRHLAGLAGYVLGRLCGHETAELTMDWSQASRTGFFNVLDQVWDHRAIEWAGFAPESLPRLVPPGSVVGRVAAPTAQSWGIGPDVPVISAGHDHFCGAFGAGARVSGQAYLSAGTSEAHLILCDTAPPEALADPDIDMGCYVDGKRFYVHLNLLSGQLYRLWLQRLGQADDAEFQLEMAGVDPGSGGTKVLVSPGSATAEILDAPPNASNGLMMRALQEGIALAAANVTKTLAAASGLSITSCLAAGPPTKQQLWRELRIGLSETDYHFVEQQETTAMGAALLAQRAVTGTADFPVRTVQMPPLTEFQNAAYRQVKHSYESVPRRETPVHVTR